MIQDRQGMKDYCLRQLGFPLVRIDITEEAMDDCIEYCLSFLQEYYYDGADRFFMKYKLTQLDLDNEYLTIPPNIWGINKIFDFGSTTASSLNIFDVQYQLRQTDIQNFINTSLIYYQEVMSHLALVENMLVTQRQFRFNRNSDKLYIDMNWKLLTVDSYLVLDCYAVMDPDENHKFWNNLTFKKMCVAKFKAMWYTAYSKYENYSLPGGITINGREMYREAHQELLDIEDEIKNNQAPLGFWCG